MRTDFSEMFSLICPPETTEGDSYEYEAWELACNSWASELSDYHDHHPDASTDIKQTFVETELAKASKQIEEAKKRQARLLAYGRIETGLSDRRLAEIAEVSHPTVARLSQTVDLTTLKEKILDGIDLRARDERMIEEFMDTQTLTPPRGTQLIPIPGTRYWFALSQLGTRIRITLHARIGQRNMAKVGDVDPGYDLQPGDQPGCEQRNSEAFLIGSFEQDSEMVTEKLEGLCSLVRTIERRQRPEYAEKLVSLFNK